MGEPSVGGAQRLMYFLQVAGEPLGLKYSLHVHGPYAENFGQVFKVVVGGHIVGLGDGCGIATELEPLRLLPGATDVAAVFLDACPVTQRRVEVVLALAEGFETRYGLELLASVHWISHESREAGLDLDQVVRDAQSWTARNKRCSPLSTFVVHGTHSSVVVGSCAESSLARKLGTALEATRSAVANRIGLCPTSARHSFGLRRSCGPPWPPDSQLRRLMASANRVV